MLITIIVFLAVLSILVLIHELGHFFVAKKLGIKVEEFGFGLPPKVFGIKRGETVYSINLLPIGGFVKLYGEDEAGGGSVKVRSEKLEVRDKERAFYARPVWQRAAVVVAGVFMNFVLAVVLISYLFTVQGVSTPGDKVIVSGVLKNSPAEKAGLKEGDQIISIEGQKVVQPGQVIDATKKYLGKKVSLRVIPRGQTQPKEISITPRKDYPSNEGPMGVSISQNAVVTKYSWYKAPFLGTFEALKMSWLIVQGLGMVLWQLVTSGAVPKGVAGPVGIAQLTGQFVQIGTNAVLSLVALLSLNLAVLNILPIPALDGGRFAFILVEALTGKKANPKWEGYAHAVGMALLLGLIALITFHDVIRVVTGQPLLPTP